MTLSQNVIKCIETVVEDEFFFRSAGDSQILHNRDILIFQ